MVFASLWARMRFMACVELFGSKGSASCGRNGSASTSTRPLRVICTTTEGRLLYRRSINRTDAATCYQTSEIREGLSKKQKDGNMFFRAHAHRQNLKTGAVLKSLDQRPNLIGAFELWRANVYCTFRDCCFIRTGGCHGGRGNRLDAARSLHGAKRND